MNEQRLTQWEAISLMVGAGVGAGIMAVPYLTRQVGFIGLARSCQWPGLPAPWSISCLPKYCFAPGATCRSSN